MKFIYKKAITKEQREHVTKYIWDNLSKFKVLSLKACSKLAYPKLKFDINTKKDLNFINNLIKKNQLNLYTKAEQIIEVARNF